MIITVRKNYLVFLLGVSVMVLSIWYFLNTRLIYTAVNDANYKVFVAGTGTVEGQWCGETGIAIIGLETRPAPQESNELKVVDLLITNGGSTDTKFNSDVTLINQSGARFGLKAAEQPEVLIRAGATSQGTVILSVPRGIPESEWLLEIKGGNLQDGVFLPLKINKVRD